MFLTKLWQKATTLTAEGLQPLQCVQGPDFDGVVIGAREELVAADREGEYRSGVVFQYMLTTSGFNVPHPNGLVCRCTQQPIAGHLHCPHNLIMALQMLHC